MSKSLDALREALQAAPSNSFAPLSRQSLEELGVSPLLGTSLWENVEGIFKQNPITPSVALQHIQALHKRLESLQETMRSLTSALTQLKIGAEELQPGEMEIGVLIPREAVKNRLQEFGTELTRLNHTFGVFSELVTGGREGFRIRAVASSDLSVFLDVAPEVGACLAIAVERIVALYKQVLEIKKLRKEMADTGVPETALAPVDEHANGLMAAGIDPLVKELFDKYSSKGRDKHRRNELEVNLRAALNAIANRVDSGYNIEVRTTPPLDMAKTPEAQREAINTVLQASTTMQFLRPTGERILGLPESTDKATGDTTSEPPPAPKA